MSNSHGTKKKAITGSKRTLKKKPCILILDDDRDIVNILVEALKEEGYTNVCGTYSIPEAYKLNKKFDLIVVDIYLKDDRGDIFVKDYITRNPSAKTLLMTGKKIPKGEVALTKPFEIEKFIEKVRVILL